MTTTNRNRKLLIYLDDETSDRLEKYRAKTGVSKSTFGQMAIQEKLTVLEGSGGYDA